MLWCHAVTITVGMLPPVDNNDTVTYSVQLNRDNQELGIILGRNITWYTIPCICCIDLGISNTGEFMIKALMDGVARR